MEPPELPTTSCFTEPRMASGSDALSNSSSSSSARSSARSNSSASSSASSRSVAPARSTEAFERFVATAEPRLRRAFAGIRDHHLAKDAVNAALTWAWEHWDRTVQMENPIGYLYRVGQSATRSPKDVTKILPPPASIGLPDPEPGLIPALIALPERQRVVVWLVHGCEWTHREVAEALEISPSTVATHVDRALIALRVSLDAAPPVSPPLDSSPSQTTPLDSSPSRTRSSDHD